LTERWNAHGALFLGAVVAVLLLAPTLLGAAVGSAVGVLPLGAAVGAALGVAAASIVVTRTILDRYARLAPPEPKEDTTE
jgi:hypothetical protein